MPLPATEKSHKPGPIGLDIGTTRLHLCQLRPQDDGRYSVVTKSSLDFDGERRLLLEDPRHFRRLIRQVMANKPFRGKRVCACVPADQLRIFPVSYNARTRNADGEILSQVEQRLQRDAADLVVDYLPLRQNNGDDEQVVLASAAEREDINRLLQTLTGAGLEPMALDIGPAAIKRLIGVLNSQQQEPSHALVVNTGTHQSYLTFVSGRRLLLDQTVDFSSEALLEKLSKTLRLPREKVSQLIHQHGIDPQRTLTPSSGETAETLRQILKPDFLRLNEEIQRVLLYTASETRGQSLNRLDLLGSIARWPGAWQLLVDLLGLDLPDPDTEFRNCFLDDNDHTEPWINQLSEMAIATGLALRGIDES